MGCEIEEPCVFSQSLALIATDYGQPLELDSKQDGRPVNPTREER
jgi:hypothetical protein